MTDAELIAMLQRAMRRKDLTRRVVTHRREGRRHSHDRGPELLRPGRFFHPEAVALQRLGQVFPVAPNRFGPDGLQLWGRDHALVHHAAKEVGGWDLAHQAGEAV